MLRSYRGQCMQRSMLFPACGAFQKQMVSESGEAQQVPTGEFDPDEHLYPSEQNDGMQFVPWDKERVERENSDNEVDRNMVWSMAGKPQAIAS